MSTRCNLYGHLFPDREDALVAGVDDRYQRALKASQQANNRHQEERNFRQL